MSLYCGFSALIFGVANLRGFCERWTLYFDDYDSHRYTEIGPRIRGLRALFLRVRP